MIKNRNTQLKKRELAAKMIDFGMRASIISAVFDLPLSQARALYKEITGFSSPSGQKPRSEEYYFSPVMRVHSSVFMMFYRYISQSGVDVRSALVAAYSQYSKTCQDGKTKLPIDRAWRLIILASQKNGVVRETRCTSCGTYMIIQAWESVTR
ncbi:MAG: FlhC family transcriptional regulator, partial [Georgfuchsia sp.]